MIAWLKGQLIEKQAPTILLDVNGVGYELEAPMSTFYELPAVGETVTLFVHMVVREDAQLLFAFSSKQQRELFRSLIKVNGVGPKVALAILSTLTAQELLSCMVNEDVTQLCKVPGIGKKTAERLMVEMKNRFADQVSGVDDYDPTEQRSAKQDAIEALQALGYKHNDVVKAMKGMDTADMTSEQIIRQGLQTLSGRVL